MPPYQEIWHQLKLKTPRETVCISCKVRRSSQIRHISYYIESRDYLTLRLPSNVNINTVHPFLQDHATRILSYMRRFPRPPSLKDYLRRNPMICLYGKEVKVCMEEVYDSDTHTEYLPHEKEFLIRICENDRKNEIEIKRILVQCAKNALPLQTRRWAHIHQIKINKVTVRDQKTRWGSCSSSANISLNWRLILFPCHVCNHVILHELAHRTHMNHFNAFKDLLMQYDPNSKENQKWIKKNGSHIMRLGR